MVNLRALGFLSTLFLLVGALLVGNAFHVVFVEQAGTVTSVGFVSSMVIGGILLFLGYRARAPIADAYGLTSDDEDESEPAREPDTPSGDDTETEFDPELSPLGDADPTDRDES